MAKTRSHLLSNTEALFFNQADEIESYQAQISFYFMYVYTKSTPTCARTVIKYNFVLLYIRYIIIYRQLLLLFTCISPNVSIYASFPASYPRQIFDIESPFK